MSEMIFKLLCPLDCEEMVATCSKTAKVVGVITIISITKLVWRILEFQSQIPTHSSTTRVLLHVGPHLINGILPWLDSHICKNAVFWIHEFAEAFEEEHMRRQFTLIFMLDNKEHIVIRFACIFVVYFGHRVIEVNPRVLQVIILQTYWVKDRLIKAWIDVSLT